MAPDDVDLLTAFGKYGVLPGLSLYAGQLFYSKFLSARSESVESGASNSLVIGLSARITVLEARQTQVEADLDKERGLRFQAESKVAALQLRVSSLEAQLQHAGITPA